MKLASFLWIIPLTMLLAACSASSSAPNSTAAATPSAGDSAPAQAAESSMPIPPEGAKYTLLCISFNAPTHVSDADQAKQTLLAHTDLKDFYVLHGEQQSDLFYGFYKTYTDRSQTEEYARSQEDMAKVASLLNDQGDRLFPLLMFVPLPTPDPPAPKEWDLSQNTGYWTLQIAIYRNSPERKQAAVDAVRDARSRGIEAYYHHGKTSSGVFVGSWPEQAAKITDSFSATSDPHQPVMVLSGPIAGSDNPEIYDAQGQKMQVEMPKLEVFDPTLQKAISDYPYTYINGAEMGRTNSHTGQVVPYPSFLVKVPHGSAGSDQDSDQPSADQGQSPIAPDNPNLPPPDAPPSGPQQ